MTARQRYYSTVYWHFTGSPKGIDWDTLRKRSDIKADPKPLDESVELLMKILKSQKLKATAKVKITEILTTEYFSCVTDIPLKDPFLHSKVYGIVALGFRAAAIHKCFIPVLYIPENSLPQFKIKGPFAFNADAMQNLLGEDEAEARKQFEQISKSGKSQNILISVG